jgi:putative acetyltransferase
LILAPASPGDFPALAAVAADAYRTGFAGILRPDALAKFDAAHFALRFALETATPVLARDGDGVLGFHLTENGHIKMLFVAPIRQAHGIGSELLADAERRGARTLETFAENASARRFYERRGWRCVREFRGQFGGEEHGFAVYGKFEPQMT